MIFGYFSDFRNQMKKAIRNKADRAKLEPRKEPYWHQLDDVPVYVGFYKAETGPGSWLARWRDTDGKQNRCALKTADDFPDASKLARDWYGRISKGVKDEDTTVGLACRRYLDDLRLRSGENSARDAEGRFSRLVFGRKIEKTKLHELTKAAVTAWRDAQVRGTAPNEDAGRKARDTANRNLSTLKAALNRALADDLIVSDRAWSTVTSFKDAGSRRPTYLTQDQRQALLKGCGEELGQLIHGLLLTGFRPGELANATVADFDRTNGTIELSGKTGARTATLSTQAVALFAELSTGKIGRAPIFTRADGQAWNKDAWKKPFKAAARAAKLPPDTVLYSLRHAALSDQIRAGIDSLLVARNAGTSVQMIERHYGHFKTEHVRAQLDKAQSGRKKLI